MLFCVLFLSCNDNPVKYEQPVYTSTLTVIVKDSAGVPINGAQVVTYPETIQLVTDQNGMVVFNDIKRQQYQVVVSRSDIPVFYQNVNLGFKPLTIQFTIALEVTVNLTVKYITGVPLDSTEISTSPPTSVVFTNADGTARMENVPVKAYTFIIKRGNSNAYIKNKMISVRFGVIQDLELIVDSQPPHIAIVEPAANYYHSIFDLTFRAEGLDFEDGQIPSDSFVWYSNVDGELGRGSVLKIDRLSVGHHYITVIGTDSDNNHSQHMISITLFFYSKDSYFPIPPMGYWEYSNSPRSFSLTDNEGVTQNYILYDMDATMQEVNARKCTMLYRNDSPEGQKWYQYTVTDYYDNDIDQFFVIKTVELLEYWRDIAMGSGPFSKVTIETDYDTKFPLLRDHLNITENENFTYESFADVTWLFEGVIYGTQKYKERMDVVSETMFEGYETIDTDMGRFETAKLKMRQGETERLWWLARGWGIVKYTYNTFGIPVTATITDSNLGDMQFNELETKKAASAPTITAKIPDIVSGTAPSEDLRNLVNMFRGMAPR